MKLENIKFYLKVIKHDLSKWLSIIREKEFHIHVIKMSIPANGYEGIKKEIKEIEDKHKNTAVGIQFTFMGQEIGNLVCYDFYFTKKLTPKSRIE